MVSRRSFPWQAGGERDSASENAHAATPHLHQTRHLLAATDAPMTVSPITTPISNLDLALVHAPALAEVLRHGLGAVLCLSRCLSCLPGMAAYPWINLL